MEVRGVSATTAASSTAAAPTSHGRSSQRGRRRGARSWTGVTTMRMAARRKTRTSTTLPRATCTAPASSTIPSAGPTRSDERALTDTSRQSRPVSDQASSGSSSLVAYPAYCAVTGSFA